MFTQCPDCGTVFRVTATVLRAARGQVRCGVCDATFDALQYLTEEVDGEDAAAPRGPAANDTAENEMPYARDDDGPADAAAAEDEDAEDEFADEDLADAETEEAILDAAGRLEPPRDDGGDFPLEELDDPIDVIAPGDRGPAPEFPPFAPEAANDEPESRPEPAFAAGHTGEAAGDDVASFMRAGRHTPSADEDRAIAEIAAQLARQAQAPATPGGAETRGDAPRRGGVAGDAPVEPGGSDDFDLAENDAPSIEIDLLDPSVAENIVLEGGDDIPETALEFDLPAEEWDRVFVPDAEAPTIPPLDDQLQRARATALQPPAPRGSARDDHFGSDDVELELDEDDGDLDEDDLLERGLDGHGQPRDVRNAAPPRAAPPPARALHAPGEDPLSQTDEFPPLRVTLAEEAAAGLADTPDAKPRTGVTPEDFDALVAAAAARAAAEVAARVGSTGATGATTAAHASSAAPLPQVAHAVAAALHEPPEARTRGSAEAAWFDARRDIAPEGAAIATVDPDELIQFDAQRFQAIARGRTRRPWWATTLLALGALVLALALAAQAVHYWRETLAQHPVFGPPLRDLYARLGMPLEPAWNLAAYEVKQWGATSDVAPGTLRVRASIVNRAPFAQPHPLLRVTLLDRFSSKVARREFAPAEYLPGRSAPTDLLAPGARVDADLAIADPGSDAVGFELDVCLKRKGVLSCAGDLRLAAPAP